MKYYFISFAMSALFFACDHQATAPGGIDVKAEATLSNDFFPVTNFIQGQMVEMRETGINPLKITTTGNKVDSAWLKVEELEKAFAHFLTPTIDSVHLWNFFKENKFLDQTLNTYTFTYEPLSQLPDSLGIQRWDVYINPKNQTVKRIYIEKTVGNKQLQLTWQTNEWCRIVTLSPDRTGNEKIEKEELIKWKFE